MKRTVFFRAKRLERLYSGRLRKIARHVGDIVRDFVPNDFEQLRLLQETLVRYSQIIQPWANAVAGRMVAEVDQQDLASWRRLSKVMGRHLAQEIAGAPTGRAMRLLLDDQVKLITSLPVEAGRRVHDLTIQGLQDATRASEIAKEIMRTGEVTASRAMLIARTETSRTSTVLTQTRAQHAGSEYFIWRTSEDSDVRPMHRALNGRTFRWSDPPECDPGIHALPGAVFNCRCYCEPLFPDD